MALFHQMLKILYPLKPSTFEHSAAEFLRAILADVPFITGVGRPKVARSSGSWTPDFELGVSTSQGKWRLACEVKTSGEPRHIRAAAILIRNYAEQAAKTDGPLYPLVAAPHLSQASQDICKDAGVGFFDLAGNCHISFSTIYISKRGAENPFKQRRVQRSLFAPKSSRVLRVLLRQPAKHWKVAELASTSGVSIGQVSNVRKRLLDMELAKSDVGGLWISKPRELLDLWRDSHRAVNASSPSFYTLLHGPALDEAIRSAQGGDGAHAVLASHSAAALIAPYLRTSVPTVFYADKAGAEKLRRELRLEPAEKGANVTVIEPQDDGPFLDRIERSSGIWVTSALQTYLDLAASGERGREAAEYLFEREILPAWQESHGRA